MSVGAPLRSTEGRLFRLGAAIAFLSLVFDQATKAAMLGFVMDPPRVIPITPFFSLTLGFNRGASFGMFSTDAEFGRWALTALALVIVAGLVIWLARTQSRLEAMGVGAIIGGALGNVADRVRQGAVTDFLDFYVGNWHWPAFNMADASITLGVAALLIAPLVERRAS